LAESLWNRCLRVLERNSRSKQFNTWVRPLQAIERDGELKLLAPNRYVIEWLGQNSLARIKELIRAFAEDPAPEVVLDVGTRPVSRPGGCGQRRPHRQRRGGQSPQACASVLGGPINSGFTFDSFVEGKSNQLAKAAAIQVAGNPGRAYNPLFIYGGVGLADASHACGGQQNQRK